MKHSKQSTRGWAEAECVCKRDMFSRALSLSRRARVRTFFRKQESVTQCFRSIGTCNHSHTMADRLVWVDLEMTGLDIEKDTILEMACLVTDSDLDVIAEGPDIVVHHPDSVLNSMGEWCKEHHRESGLTAASRSSRLSLEETERQMLAFIQQHVPKGKCPLAGNTIHMDRRFLDKYMPQFMEHLHYRLVDVSSIKELCRRWYPKQFSNAPSKDRRHRALDDIKESIAELHYYRETIFK